VGFSYRPDYTDDAFGYIKNLEDDSGNIYAFDPFNGTQIGATPSGEQRSINISVRNLFQAKVQDGEEERKIDNLLTWNMNTSYNFAADEFRLAKLRSTFRAGWLKKLNLDFSMSHDFYDTNTIDGQSVRIKEIKTNSWGLPTPRMTNMNAATGFKISGKRLGWSDSPTETDTTENDTSAFADLMGGGIARPGNRSQYVVQFPTNRLAPVAQKWIADHQFQFGKFAEAEQGYRRLFENTNLLANARGLEWEARLNAGRSAFFRQEHAAAELLLASVINATNAPVAEQARAEFFLGDVAADQTQRTPTNLLDALPHYQRVANEMIGSPLHPLAWGRVGDCYLQLGNLGPAADAYRAVTELPGTDVTTRSQAGLGLARVLEEQAALAGETEEREELLQKSLNQCMKIVFGANLRSASEKMAPFWVKEAGLMAGHLAGRLGLAKEERSVYSRLAKELPDMPLWQAKLDALKVGPEAPKAP
jgi:tetratricopeptide (TPR) repeat protein